MSAGSRLADWLIARAQRTPYFHIDGYMERFWLIKPRRWLPFSIRVHHILRSDSDRHLHDHPWGNCSVLLRGSYTEVLPVSQGQNPFLDGCLGGTREVIRSPGSVVLRRATTRHRLVLTSPVWTIFIMWRHCRRWGFYTRSGWVYWRDYLNDYDTTTANDVAPGKGAS